MYSYRVIMRRAGRTEHEDFKTRHMADRWRRLCLRNGYKARVVAIV